MSIIDFTTNKNITSVPAGSVLVLGYFDGVHIGHSSLIEEALRLSKEHDNAPVCIWTFESLPKVTARLITTKNEKCALLKAQGSSYIIFESFDALRGLDGEEFFSGHIVKNYSPAAVVCGFNFRFGKNAAWTAADLCHFAKQNGVECSVVHEKTIDGKTISSTEIRRLIEIGQVDCANRLLGRAYEITAEIEHGVQIGRKMGVRTINQHIPEGKVVPGNGVYCCTVTFDVAGDSVTYGGICNIGSRPTVNDNVDDVTVETHIFDFDGDIYGNSVTTRLYKKLRDERKFDSIDTLRQQIESDLKTAKLLLKEILK